MSIRARYIRALPVTHAMFGNYIRPMRIKQRQPGAARTIGFLIYGPWHLLCNASYNLFLCVYVFRIIPRNVFTTNTLKRLKARKKSDDITPIVFEMCANMNEIDQRHC